MLRPATPLTALFFIAFMLLLLVSLSTPISRGITLSEYAGIRYGVWGMCNVRSGRCSSLQIGYTLNDLRPTGYGFKTSATTRQTISYTLIAHPIAALFTLICLSLAVFSHLHAPSHSVGYQLGMLLMTIPTLAVSILAFFIDLLLFTPHLTWGVYLVLAATIALFIASIITCTMRRGLSSRKAQRKRIVESEEVSKENYYNRKAVEAGNSPVDSPSFSGGSKSSLTRMSAEVCRFDVSGRPIVERTRHMGPSNTGFKTMSREKGVYNDVLARQGPSDNFNHGPYHSGFPRGIDFSASSRHVNIAEPVASYGGRSSPIYERQHDGQPADQRFNRYGSPSQSFPVKGYGYGSIPPNWRGNVPAQGGFGPSERAKAPSRGGFDFKERANAPSRSGFDFQERVNAPSRGGFDFREQVNAPSRGGFAFSERANASSQGGFAFSERANASSQGGLEFRERTDALPLGEFEPGERVNGPSRAGLEIQERENAPSRSVLKPLERGDAVSRDDVGTQKRGDMMPARGYEATAKPYYGRSMPDLTVTNSSSACMKPQLSKPPYAILASAHEDAPKPYHGRSVPDLDFTVSNAYPAFIEPEISKPSSPRFTLAYKETAKPYHGASMPNLAATSLNPVFIEPQFSKPSTPPTLAYEGDSESRHGRSMPDLAATNSSPALIEPQLPRPSSPPPVPAILFTNAVKKVNKSDSPNQLQATVQEGMASSLVQLIDQSVIPEVPSSQLVMSNRDRIPAQTKVDDELAAPHVSGRPLFPSSAVQDLGPSNINDFDTYLEDMDPRFLQTSNSIQDMLVSSNENIAGAERKISDAIPVALFASKSAPDLRHAYSQMPESIPFDLQLPIVQNPKLPSGQRSQHHFPHDIQQASQHPPQHPAQHPSQFPFQNPSPYFQPHSSQYPPQYPSQHHPQHFQQYPAQWPSQHDPNSHPMRPLPRRLRPSQAGRDARIDQSSDSLPLQNGRQSPVLSDSSNYTSVSQRGINPAWHPSFIAKNPRPGPGPGAGRRWRPRPEEVLLNTNPDFSLPIGRASFVHGRGRGRVGSFVGGPHPEAYPAVPSFNRDSRYPIPL